MAAQPQTPQWAGRYSKRAQLIEAGELVSNAPLRERCEWLLKSDPDFSLCTVCARMAEQGYPNFTRRGSERSRTRVTGDTSHLLRVLGMRLQAPTVKNGRRYQPPSLTEWVPYELAVALCRALEMWPVDAGV